LFGNLLAAFHSSLLPLSSG